MKICSRCKKSKPLEEFGIDKYRKDGLNLYCKTCVNLNSRESHKRNLRKREYDPMLSKKRRDNRTKEQKAMDSINKRDSFLRNKYGLSIEQYNVLFKQQNGKCAICERHQDEFNNALAVDHNHLTGEIRGLLCSICNRILGFLKIDETVKFAENLVDYVVKI